MSRQQHGGSGAQRSQGVHTVSKLVLLFGFLMGPIAWSVHLIASEALISTACASGPGGFSAFSLFGVAGWRVVLLLVTAGLMLLVLAADAAAFWAWRRAGIGTRLSGDAGGVYGRSGWMALAGVLLSTLFFVAMLFALAPIFWLSGCT